MAIYKNLKAIASTTLSLFLCAVAIAPASAQYSPRQSQQPTQRRMMQQQEQQIGRIRSVSSTTSTSTVVVALEDGTTQTLQVSNANPDLGQARLKTNDYVLIRNERIVGVANRGTIANMMGSTAEIELENGETREIEVSRADMGTMNLTQGSEVYVVNNQIVAPASSMTSQTGGTTTTPDTTTPSTTTPSTTDETTTPGTTTTPSTTDETTTPGTTTTPSTTDETTTDDVDTEMQETQTPEQTEEPVRGMW
ncbi:hypothetical protein Ple7327_4505 [Pleurocapsa sp. PCC 7327]|uniref:hypothetical protein n=1 Tax=Pleurocapsa sp. PCC 7327 TaxID=118163 RepID=UPI00029F9B46|nr:hypothetical protein [Pleurocapsa sp. PCC 7327]AFY79606.1 hypothetical protein Ple7327_4505 [Pleurocapsa sp. PCC 7327]